uniref:C-type lectin domain-containing protein n=1 Tax=Steinernema glaseri TaxID=37863 RepID=A0A1I7Y150_9BILA
MVLPLSGAALLSLFGLVSATKCPTDGIRNYFANHDKTKCFFFLDHPLEFFDSNYLCGDNGGMLASIGTPEDNKIIAQHSSGHAKAWIGGVDYLDLGNWYWLDDSHFAYWNWGPDEPKHFPLHDCAAIDTVTGFWENHLCNKKMNALCQVISIPDSSKFMITVLQSVQKVL